MVDLVYKYIHHMITEEELIAGLVVVKNNNLEYATDLEQLIQYIQNRIDNYTGELFDDVVNKLLKSSCYKKICEEMTVKDIFNLMMDCYPYYSPTIEQEHFNDLLNIALEEKDPCEMIWRLIELYIPSNLNLDRALDFILLSEKANYIGAAIAKLEGNERLPGFAKKLLRMNNKKIFSELIEMEYLSHIINFDAIKKKINGE